MTDPDPDPDSETDDLPEPEPSLDERPRTQVQVKVPVPVFHELLRVYPAAIREADLLRSIIEDALDAREAAEFSVVRRGERFVAVADASVEASREVEDTQINASVPTRALSRVQSAFPGALSQTGALRHAVDAALEYRTADEVRLKRS